jgi:hypothetical protein
MSEPTAAAILLVCVDIHTNTYIQNERNPTQKHIYVLAYSVDNVRDISTADMEGGR